MRPNQTALRIGAAASQAGLGEGYSGDSPGRAWYGTWTRSAYTCWPVEPPTVRRKGCLVGVETGVQDLDNSR